METSEIRKYILEQEGGDMGGEAPQSDGGGEPPAPENGEDGDDEEEEKPKPVHVFGGGGYGWIGSRPKRACGVCLHFVNGKCKIRDSVISRHGEASLEDWISNPTKKNSCSLFSPDYD